MWRTLNLLAFVGVVYFGATWGLQWYRAPWPMPQLGPTLTGTWEGPLQAKLGAQYRVFLELNYRDIRNRIYLGSTLTGRGRICTPQGDVYEYELDGNASRNGDRVEIKFSTVGPAGATPALDLDGSWNGPGQTLTLRPVSNPFQPDGSYLPNRPVSTIPDDSFEAGELRKSDPASFLVGCGRLAG